MSMRHTPASGHIAKLSLFVEKLDLWCEQKAGYETLMERSRHQGCDGNDIMAFIDPILKSRGLPALESAFRVDDDFTGDDLEMYEWYVASAPDELYSRKLTPAGELLAALGVERVGSQWTVFG